MKFRIMLVLLALVMPTVTNALGLGKLELQSALNQPFKARVELLSATADELDSLKVALADQEAFDRAGIQRTFLLTRLRFAIQESEVGPDYIQIRSSESIREPFLNFLLEINWSKGRLFREYTVLLDPPTYIAPVRKKAVVHPEKPVVKINSDDHQVVYDLDYKPDSKTKMSQPTPVTPSYESPSSYEAPSTINYSGSGDYGPAVAGDTLWSIAKAARPDSSVSIQQMMLTILSANPDAFIENNINGLKRGAILEIPDSTEIDSLDQVDVLAQVNNQHALWDEYKGHVSNYVSQQAESSGGYEQATEEAEKMGDVEQDSSVADIEDTGEAELRLISEPDQGTGSDQSSAESTGVDVDALNNELALANESIEAMFLENAELKDKLTETEGIIDDLKRLIVLKEDELAAMQEQIMIAAAEDTGAVTEEMEEEYVEEAEEVIEDESIEVDEAEEEGVAEEEMDAEASESEDEVIEVIEEIVITDDEGIAALSGLMDMAMGVLEQAKAYLMTIVYVIGGLLLLVFLMIFASKRRSAKATAIDLPAENFPDFGDDYSDETIALSEGDSEAVTVIPGSEDETILPGDDSDAQDDPDDSFDIPDIPEEESSPAAVEEPEDDPMEEVNVFLAYEHFDEAESFVRNALEGEPENLDFHSKLLEVFYAAGNKKSYEAAAKVVHEQTGGQGEYWDMAAAMWQEMSPNRAIFETPVEGEDDAAAESIGGGVLNIADEADGSGSNDMDFNIGEEESGEDMLDVTAAADIDDIPTSTETEASASDDLDLSLDMDDTLGLSAEESNELLDDTIQMEPSDVQQLQQDSEESEELLDVTTAIDLEDDVSESVSEDALELDISASEEDTTDDVLDLSLGEENLLDVSIAQESDDSNDLDISFGDTSGDDSGLLDESADLDVTTAIDLEDDVSESVSEDALELDISASEEDTTDDVLDLSLGEENLLDVSIAQESDDSNDLDISFGDTSGDDSGLLDESTDLDATASADDLDISFGDTSDADEENLLDVSIAQESDDSNDLDISFGDTSGDDSGLLDESTDLDATASADDLDISFGDTSDTDGEDLLDVSIAQESDDSNDLDISFGDTSSDSEDLLDVTSAIDFESEGTDDLLDVTTATSANVELDDIMESDIGGDLDIGLEGESDDLLMDIGDADSSDSVDLELDLSDDINDLGMDMDIPDIDAESEIDSGSIDMDSTVQMPPASVDSLSMDEDDDDKTFLVPKSSNIDEQTDDEEMASQLDLAKAYIELGDTENAKTILDEIIAQGSDTYRQQAEELIGQIN